MAERKIGCVNVIEYPLGSNSFVLVEETKKNKKGTYNLPGGRLNYKDGYEETLFEAAKREAQEETGLEVELIGFLGLFDYRQDGQLQIAFVANAVSGQLTTSKEHPTVESFPLEIIENVLEPQGILRSPRVLESISQYYRGDILPTDAVRINETDVLAN